MKNMGQDMGGGGLLSTGCLPIPIATKMAAMAPFGVEMINIYGKYLWETYTYMGNNRYCDTQAVNGLYNHNDYNIRRTLVGNKIVDHSSFST